MAVHKPKKLAQMIKDSHLSVASNKDAQEAAIVVSSKFLEVVPIIEEVIHVLELDGPIYSTDLINRCRAFIESV